MLVWNTIQTTARKKKQKRRYRWRLSTAQFIKKHTLFWRISVMLRYAAVIVLLAASFAVGFGLFKKFNQTAVVNFTLFLWAIHWEVYSTYTCTCTLTPRIQEKWFYGLKEMDFYSMIRIYTTHNYCREYTCCVRKVHIVFIYFLFFSRTDVSQILFCCMAELYYIFYPVYLSACFLVMLYIHGYSFLVKSNIL